MVLENEFVWRGVRSLDMGVVVQEMPGYKRPSRRLDKVAIPGRSGEVVEDLFGHDVWEDVQYTLNLAVKPGYDRIAVLEWLSGDGELVLGSVPDSVYHARIEVETPSNEIAPGHPGSYLQLAPTFVCSPWRYELFPRPAVDVLAGAAGRNPFDFSAAPLLRVEGAVGTVLAVAAGGRTLQVRMTAASAVIDCDLEAADGATTGGEFVQLPPGEWVAEVSVTSGAVSSVMLEPRYRRV